MMDMKHGYKQTQITAAPVLQPKKAMTFHDLHLMIVEYVKPWGGEVISTQLTGKDGRNRGTEITIKFTAV
jgi:hypothetical protein